MTKEKTMDIKAVKFRKDGFYSQPFAFGGEEGQEKFDRNIRYRGSLQNYLITTFYGQKSGNHPYQLDWYYS